MKILLATMCVACVFETSGQQATVTLDNYFNREWKKDSSGKKVLFHYTWDDKENSGFSRLGDIFVSHGLKKNVLSVAPTLENLSGTHIYIIVDPDTDVETPNPNYIQRKDIKAIKAWVKKGGVLVLMGNDSANAEFQHFNQLAAVFGIHFDENDVNHVVGENFEQGAIPVPAGHPIFKSVHKLFMKDISTISVKDPARVVLKRGADNIIVVSSYGKGTVFAVGDPWLYNEYVDGRLPSEFQNYTAANDLVTWLAERIHR